MNLTHDVGTFEDATMATRTNISQIPKLALGLLLVIGSPGQALQAATGSASDISETTDRVSSSTSYLRSDSENPGAWIQRRSVAEALLTGPRSSAIQGRRDSNKTAPPSALIAQAVNDDFWIYDAWVELSYDQDRDGYFTDFRLTFDADTYYSVADVFAVVYLSYQGGPWNEIAYTNPYTLYSNSPDDQYVIETTLATGYPTGDYDLLIEIYDAYTGYLVADLGPEWADLSYLPLEDQYLDTPYQAPVYVSHGGGGSADWLLLAALALAWLSARFSKSRTTVGAFETRVGAGGK
jgi:hypothetical protein